MIIESLPRVGIALSRNATGRFIINNITNRVGRRDGGVAREFLTHIDVC